VLKSVFGEEKMKKKFLIFGHIEKKSLFSDDLLQPLGGKPTKALWRKILQLVFL
jgi:hypothetical protein